MIIGHPFLLSHISLDRSPKAVKLTPSKLSYLYQCVGCDAFHLQAVGRIIQKVLILKVAALWEIWSTLEFLIIYCRMIRSGIYLEVVLAFFLNVSIVGNASTWVVQYGLNPSTIQNGYRWFFSNLSQLRKGTLHSRKYKGSWRLFLRYIKYWVAFCSCLNKSIVKLYHHHNFVQNQFALNWIVYREICLPSFLC
jgi:hypothetical protein